MTTVLVVLVVVLALALAALAYAHLGAGRRHRVNPTDGAPGGSCSRSSPMRCRRARSTQRCGSPPPRTRR